MRSWTVFVFIQVFTLAVTVGFLPIPAQGVDLYLLIDNSLSINEKNTTADDRSKILVAIRDRIRIREGSIAGDHLYVFQFAGGIERIQIDEINNRDQRGVVFKEIKNFLLNPPLSSQARLRRNSTDIAHALGSVIKSTIDNESLKPVILLITDGIPDPGGQWNIKEDKDYEQFCKKEEKVSTQKQTETLLNQEMGKIKMQLDRATVFGATVFCIPIPIPCGDTLNYALDDSWKKFLNARWYGKEPQTSWDNIVQRAFKDIRKVTSDSLIITPDSIFTVTGKVIHGNVKVSYPTGIMPPILPITITIDSAKVQRPVLQSIDIINKVMKINIDTKIPEYSVPIELHVKDELWPSEIGTIKLSFEVDPNINIPQSHHSVGFITDSKILSHFDSWIFQHPSYLFRYSIIVWLPILIMAITSVCLIITTLFCITRRWFGWPDWEKCIIKVYDDDRRECGLRELNSSFWWRSPFWLGKKTFDDLCYYEGTPDRVRKQLRERLKSLPEKGLRVLPCDDKTVIIIGDKEASDKFTVQLHNIYNTRRFDLTSGKFFKQDWLKENPFEILEIGDRYDLNLNPKLIAIISLTFLPLDAHRLLEKMCAWIVNKFLKYSNDPDNRRLSWVERLNIIFVSSFLVGWIIWVYEQEIGPIMWVLGIVNIVYLFYLMSLKFSYRALWIGPTIIKIIPGVLEYAGYLITFIKVLSKLGKLLSD